MEDKTINFIYEHYKETNCEIRSVRKERSKYFISFCIMAAILFLFFIDPTNTFNNLKSIIVHKFEINIEYKIVVVQSLMWVLLFYCLTRYIQTNVYMERSYQYLEQLENKLSSETQINFNRESEEYLRNYPKVLDAIDIFYKWIVPCLLIIAVTIKIINEWWNNSDIGFIIFDSIIYLCLVIVTILYLVFIKSV